MEIISGGVTAPIGFLAAGMHAGVRKNKKKKDMALLVSKCPAKTAGVFTQNVVKAAPVMWDKALCDDIGLCQALVVNSGVANACTGEAGDVDVAHMAELAAAELQVPADQVAVASTGVIGIRLPMETIAHGIRELSGMLSDDLESGSHAAEAIMTTDVYKKEIAVKLQIKGKTITVGGMCKGSGMINPNLGTVLGFLTTDLNISQELLQKTLRNDVIDTYNMLSVDGDTSTNDTVMIFANGMAGNDELLETDADYPAFAEALRYINTYFVKLIAADGEGASKLLECKVSGAADVKTAKTVAKSVICSSLLKAAMFGADANWGRVLCAIGYSGADVDVSKIGVSFESPKGKIEVCRGGSGVDFSEEKAKEILLEKEIGILVDLGSGDAEATAWGCDLTYDYVKINGDYRT